MTILDEIAEYAGKRVAENKKTQPYAVIRDRACAMPEGEFAFEKALKRDGFRRRSRAFRLSGR